MSGAITVLAITLRSVWPAQWALAGLSVFGLLSLTGRRFPPLRSFLLLFVPLIVLSTWGGANWAAEGLRDSTHWRGDVQNVLGIASALFTIYVPWRYRNVPRSWILGPAALTGLVLTAGAWFVGGMAIADSWL